jgi:hypothetical protein
MPELQRDHRTVPQPLGAATLSGWALFGVSAADAVLAAVGAYHESEPAKLIERVREGLVRYDAGEIDAFELDDLVHHYKRATQKLWSFRVGSADTCLRWRGRSSGCASRTSCPTGGSRRRHAAPAADAAAASLICSAPDVALPPPV